MTTIASFSLLHLNPDQQAAASLLEQFTQSGDEQIFVLDGYAGTGKTSLIAAYIQYLKSCKRQPVLLASTGRAAKVVSEKAMHAAETVHRHIYLLKAAETDQVKKERKLVFKIKENTAAENAVYIIDESSMLSDHANAGNFLDFGTGRLLADLLLFVGKRKIVFVGDGAQLPPVQTKFPPVFNTDYLLKTFQLRPVQAKLTIQERFDENSSMFKLADEWRKAVVAEKRLSLRIETEHAAEMQVFTDTNSITQTFAKIVRQSGVDDAIFICFSNRRAHELNSLVRTNLFPKKTKIQKGEILIVVYNNYRLNITNGEHLIVDEVQHTEKRAGLTFRHILGRVKDFQGYRSFSARIIEDLLYQPLPGLTNEQETDLFTDYVIRMKAKGMSIADEAFITNQMNDPYLNALRVKFGYAITCHKAQGGEWQRVFIDFENGLLMQQPAFYLRWAYTAISRASKNLLLLKKSFIK